MSYVFATVPPYPLLSFSYYLSLSSAPARGGGEEREREGASESCRVRISKAIIHAIQVIQAIQAARLEIKHNQGLTRVERPTPTGLNGGMFLAKHVVGTIGEHLRQNRWVPLTKPSANQANQPPWPEPRDFDPKLGPLLPLQLPTNLSDGMIRKNSFTLPLSSRKPNLPAHIVVDLVFFIFFIQIEFSPLLSASRGVLSESRLPVNESRFPTFQN